MTESSESSIFSGFGPGVSMLSKAVRASIPSVRRLSNSEAKSMWNNVPGLSLEFAL